MAVEPVGQLGIENLFVPEMEETVYYGATIERSEKWGTSALQNANAAWYGPNWQVGSVSGTGLKFVDASGNDVSAQLHEVVYVLNQSSSGVRAAVMVFHTDAGTRRIGVGVSGATFAAKFAYTASTSGVWVSTVAWDHNSTPSASLSPTPTFPNLNVKYTGTTGPPEKSSLKPKVARIAVVAGGSTGPKLMGTEIAQTGSAYFGATVVATAGKIEPLVYTDSLLFVGMEQTVDRLESFGLSGAGGNEASWRGLENREYTLSNTPSGSTLAFQGLAASAQLREVVYVLGWRSGDVAAAVMVFHVGSRRIGVVVSGATFADKFADTARTRGVLVSTVPRAPEPVPDQSLKDTFPNVSVAWDATSVTPVTAATPAISSVKPHVPRVAVVVGSTGSTLSGDLQAGGSYLGKKHTPAATAQAQTPALAQGGAVAAVAADGTQQTTVGGSACDGYWAKWTACAADGDAACATIATCATAARAATSTLVYAGTSIELRPVQGTEGGLYGTKDSVVYVVKPAGSEQTARVIRKELSVVELRDASLTSGKWVVDAKVLPAECADLRECLKLTPLNLSNCALQAAACTAGKVASGAKLDHGDKKVGLFTLGLAEERALFGSDDRGVFVVSVSKDNGKKGKRLFVATDKKASVVDVEYDEGTATWLEVKGTNWALIGTLIGAIGGAALIAIAVVVYIVASRKRPTGFP